MGEITPDLAPLQNADRPPEIASVIVQRPLPGPLSYKIPESLRGKLSFGSCVRVPFRSGDIDGFVVGFLNSQNDDPSLKDVKLKEIREAPFDIPLFTPKDYEFFRWIGDYYQLPVGEVFHSAFPKAVLKTLKRKSSAKSKAEQQSRTTAPALALTDDQTKAMATIAHALGQDAFKSFLLFGVTGSGKTELYIRAAREVLNRGKTALILVPEIALTPQLRNRFEDHFGDAVAVMHSSLGEKARRDFWWDTLREKRKLVVGARSALFAPLSNIGLIVVDEEHEPSYKQEDRLRYSARDLALVRARQHNAVAILGSATPSIETFHAASNGKHELLELRTRPAERPMPNVELVDIKAEADTERAARKAAGDWSKQPHRLLGTRLREGLSEVIARGEQAMVFVNRKGYASFLMCRDCGEVPKCLNCSVSLTYYQNSRQLRCHYCDLRMPAIDICPKCDSRELKFMGMGTEQVEEELREIFAGIEVDRLDADLADTAGKIEATLERFRKGESQILVGTQMLAKGHDFPNVTFVGVVMADLSLHLPDFRAGERTFQLLTQVSGRAGRADKPGRVIIQTLMPDHYVLQAATTHDYASFYRAEIECRREFGYPPFSRMAKLEFRAPKEPAAKAEAQQARQLLDHLNKSAADVVALGPAPAAVAKVANQFRWQILLKSEKSSSLNAVIKTLRKEGLRYIDVDPVTTL